MLPFVATSDSFTDYLLNVLSQFTMSQVEAFVYRLLAHRIVRSDCNNTVFEDNANSSNSPNYPIQGYPSKASPDALALSYIWGCPEPTRQIFIGGQSFFV